MMVAHWCLLLVSEICLKRSSPLPVQQEFLVLGKNDLLQLLQVLVDHWVVYVGLSRHESWRNWQAWWCTGTEDIETRHLNREASLAHELVKVNRWWKQMVR